MAGYKKNPYGVSGYFRTSGYFKVRAFLNIIPKIRNLAGINVNQPIKTYHDKAHRGIVNHQIVITQSFS